VTVQWYSLPPLTESVVTSSGGVGRMARFTKKKTTYISCQAVLENEGKPWGIIFSGESNCNQ